MKRFTTLGAACLLLGLALTGCDSADSVGPDGLNGSADETLARPAYGGNTCTTVPDGYDYCVDLVAGQTQKVGEVYYGYEGSTFSIKYQLTEPGLCLDEVHYGVYDTVGAIPRNRGGNVAPGGLANSESPAGCATSYTDAFEISLTPGGGFNGGPSKDYFVAAHAVVVGSGEAGEGCDYIYGIAKDGDIYRIYLDDTAVTSSALFFDTAIGTPWNSTWPNGLALDVLNERLYFTNTEDRDGPHPLYFLDLSGAPVQQDAGELSWRNASATFFGSIYYYVPQNEGDNLYEVTFNADGTLATDAVVCPNFTGAAGSTPMFFGDIAYRDGLLYGSARIGADADPATFFTLDPATCAYEAVNTDVFLEQLAFDCDGRLVGHNTSTREFFEVDPSTGENESLGFLGNDLQFNDLASGECRCEPVEFDETAWGWGQKTFKDLFGGNQWGWIFGGSL